MVDLFSYVMQDFGMCSRYIKSTQHQIETNRVGTQHQKNL